MTIPSHGRTATVWIEQLLQDLLYGARVLMYSPGFTLGAVVVLALGVGVNLTEFQIFDALLHRHNFRDADAVLQISRDTREGVRLGFAPAAADFLRSQSNSLAWLITEDATLSTTIDSSEVRAMFVSSDYFASLAIAPSFGRVLDARDSRNGAPVADLGYDYWQTHFGADPRVIGRIIRVNNQPVEIVGVVPFDFDGINTRRTAVWLPLATRPLVFPGSPPTASDLSHPSQSLYAKLKPGIPAPAAEAELTALIRELSRRQPLYFHDDDRIEARPVEQTLLTRLIYIPVFDVFVAMVLLVLFSACANLGNMLLARGMARQREISIRMAIGADRARIVRQLMTESFLLALHGAIAGLAFANVASRVLLYLLGGPLNVRLSTGWPILTAGFILTVVSAAAFGVPSALQTVNPNRRKTRLRQSLIGVQVAVSCLLLIASSVLAHNGIALASIDIAYDYQNMVVVNPELYLSNLQPEAARRKLDAVSDRLAALPAVDRITACLATPFGGRVYLDTLPGLPRIVRNAVAPSYFSVVAFTVAQRRREFGIRIAVGARPHHVLSLLLAQNSAPVMAGAFAGAVLAVAASRIVRSVIVLPERQAVDPLGFAAGILIFLVMAVFAALSPALRALKIDPSATLRED